MTDKELQQRERAYKIWEDEGRQDGLHDVHWKRAEEEQERTDQQSSDQQSEDVTKVRREEADRELGTDGKEPGPATDFKPASAISSD
ncbi:DUF2934 domain-containing protein [Neorhizobium sp. T786]|uniref:DUF2934 domain-containing protein n=1 Tax=Pseudorhizobium xiangyangii TaxID=2883104 RepID=UPI001CFFFDCA|nr:DUF2934 domain-containing protein [Neorhizobium xiangyangii]MCB5203756.1 DUF2934 domain-containing protein [Neorhizobium xiangyangii]